jgi:CheY-like chemotaxis protein
LLSHLHVIVLTAHAVEGAAGQFIAAGCDDPLSKPLGNKLLRSKPQALASGIDLTAINMQAQYRHQRGASIV